MICSAWCLRTAGGVKRALWLIRRVCGPSCVEISSVLKMRIMHGHLGEVSVRRTSERMWKDEMQSDTRGGHHALSFPDSGRQTGERQARVTKVLEEVKWRISILREVGGLSGAKSLEQRVYHGGGKMWFGAAEEADGLMRE